jgi:ribonuclease P protein subunit RPR2
MPKGQKKLIKSSVKSSIARLISEAEAAWKKKQHERSRRYVKMIIDLVKKHKVRLQKDQKNKFCKKCHAWWIPGKTMKLIYDQKHHLIRIRCQCGYTKRL